MTSAISKLISELNKLRWSKLSPEKRAEQTAKARAAKLKNMKKKQRKEAEEKK